MRVRDGIGAAANELVLGMTYRPDGLVETITYPTDGGAAPVVATYEYDRRARLLKLSGVIDTVDYDLAGRRTQTRYANGTVQREAHDPLTGWRRTTTLRAQSARRCGTSSITTICSETSLRSTAQISRLAWTYRYDERSQLVEARRAAPGVGPLTYSYDDAANLTASSTLGAYRYGEAGAGSTLLTTAGTDTFTYDDRGHVESAPWGTHTVDAEGRLRRIDLTGGAHQEFTYGHNGALARRRDVDGANHVTRDVASPDRLVWIEDGALVLQFTDGGRIVARHDVNAMRRTWLHTDHVGSLVLVTDASGEVVLSQHFDPYGRVLVRNGAAVAPQGFATGEAAGPDLVLLGARWYCPSIGRFLSPDPLVANAYRRDRVECVRVRPQQSGELHRPHGPRLLEGLRHGVGGSRDHRTDRRRFGLHVRDRDAGCDRDRWRHLGCDLHRDDGGRRGRRRDRWHRRRARRW